ncbi:hypothetical protein EF847_15095 [Actinobacteria bacterium YIM 96077]|uniref:Uncharacterized protein n=1 Tax=Phytoactinopolyspora halophila TaxID=1981511 RepID=A0A329QT88_9ACTN|nr:hypothetical protein [Phytoactinopolyspora halophila]AYY13826.1 hypothetical protein EF847_15095 [Actinobacteria bacterium YIM 96077]RAW15630.1 hypothetical protein DPM12_08245 [Phytoactinopolyspora halophila]
MNIERLVKDTVHDMGEQVPARTGLADDVLHQARRRKHATRTAVVGGVTVAAMAGATVGVTDPLGLWSAPDPGTGIEGGPAAAGQNGSSGNTSAAEEGNAPGNEGDASSTVVELDGLDTGDAPATPWYSEGAIHLGDAEVPFDVSFGHLRELEAVEGGAVALTAHEDDGEHRGHAVHLIRENGDVEKIAESSIFSIRVSADGTLVAWAEHEMDEATGSPVRTTVRVYDVTAGEVVHSRTQEDDLGDVGGVAGFLDDNQVVLNSAKNSPDGVYIWNIVEDSVTSWLDYGFARSFAPSGTVGAFMPPNDAPDRDTSIVDTETGEEMWTANRGTFPGFSAEGEYAALIMLHGPSPWIDGVHAQQILELEPDVGHTVTINGEEFTITQEMLDHARKYRERQENSDGRRDLVIVDAATGEEVTRFDVPDPAQATWESNDSLVFQATEDDETALVRCTVGGECELATEPRAVDTPIDVSDSPYLLGEL